MTLFSYLKVFIINLLILASFTSKAHLSGFTDTSIQIIQSGVKIIYTVPADDLAELNIQSQRGSNISSQPALIRSPDYYLEPVNKGWRVNSRMRDCRLKSQHARQLEDINSYQYEFEYYCPQGIDNVEVIYKLFSEQQQGQQNFTRIFLGGELQRIRFAFDRTSITIPVQALLKQWNTQLATHFFEHDPSKNLTQSTMGLGSDGGHVTNDTRQNWSADPMFIWMGMTHIWQGLDHVLFIIALLLIPIGWRKLVLVISLFTIAHSITLGLAYFNIVKISPSITEPLIALTIIIIGIENILILVSRHSYSALKYRPLLIFAFGLIHGVGLSYQLTETSNDLPTLGRLLFFNIGVELGQLAIVCALWLPIHYFFRLKKHKSLSILLSSTVIIFGLVWLLERTLLLM